MNIKKEAQELVRKLVEDPNDIPYRHEIVAIVETLMHSADRHATDFCRDHANLVVSAWSKIGRKYRVYRNVVPSNMAHIVYGWMSGYVHTPELEGSESWIKDLGIRGGITYRGPIEHAEGGVWLGFDVLLLKGMPSRDIDDDFMIAGCHFLIGCIEGQLEEERKLSQPVSN